MIFMKKILIVDDDRAILEALTVAIEMEGYQVAAVSEKEQMWRKMTDFNPDLVILDAILTEGDGRLICTQLKEKKETCHTPVIVISAHPTVGKSIKSYGADEFVAKPFSIEELILRIKKHL